MRTLPTDHPTAVAVAEAIRRGDLGALEALLAADPELATSRLGDDDPDGMSRTLLHVATDWPGHFPGGPQTVALLVAAGADVDAPFRGGHVETPLHWAASSNDVAVLDALLDAGADIEAPGAVLGGGSPLADARGFGNWDAARRLVERGARTTIVDAAALGLDECLHGFLSDGPDPLALRHAFWAACGAGHLAAAKTLLEHGAERDWLPPWEEQTPLDVAAREGATHVVTWLHEEGAQTAAQLRGD